MLHRLTYYVTDSNTGRSIRKSTPWNPSKERIERICNIFYSDTKVKFESVNFRGAEGFDTDPYFEDVTSRSTTARITPRTTTHNFTEGMAERMAEFVTDFVPTPVKEDLVLEDYDTPFEIATKASIRHPVKRGVNGLATMEDIESLLA